MSRAVIILVLVAIGCYRWIVAYAVEVALTSWRSLSTLVLDPVHVSPVAVGGALVVLCVAVLFRHVTARVLTYVALLSVPAAACVGAMVITKPSNLVGHGGAGEPQNPPAVRVMQPQNAMPPHKT